MGSQQTRVRRNSELHELKFHELSLRDCHNYYSKYFIYALALCFEVLFFAY